MSNQDPLTKLPAADRTLMILEAIAKVEQKVDQMNELQDVTEELRAIKAMMNKQDTRWKALWRGLTQFMSLLKE